MLWVKARECRKKYFYYPKSVKVLIRNLIAKALRIPLRMRSDRLTDLGVIK